MAHTASVEPNIFSIGLRTGRWPQADAPGGPDRKFNPYRDPANGRFTFAGQGVFVGGGGSFGGGGASAGWDDPAPPRARPPAPRRTAPPRPAVAAPTVVAAPASGAARALPDTSRRHVLRNGYDYAIDPQARTRSVSGTLTLNPDQPRSRSAQARAGRPDRLPGDDGGHYIARRFNGPTEAFNHFAQDANFNRGDYRALENKWVRAKKRGESVSVNIKSSYVGASRRPDTIDVFYTINGHSERQTFSNSSRRKPHGK